MIATKEETGLPYDVVLHSDGKDNPMLDVPKIDVLVNGNRIPVSISAEPEILLDDVDAIFEWIKRHRDALAAHWNNTITDREVLNDISDRANRIELEEKMKMFEGRKITV